MFSPCQSLAYKGECGLLKVVYSAVQCPGRFVTSLEKLLPGNKNSLSPYFKCTDGTVAVVSGSQW